MSNKELAISLLNSLPEHKIGYVLAYLQGLYADEAADDRFCEDLVDEYEVSADKGDFISLEDAMKLCEVDDAV